MSALSDIIGSAKSGVSVGTGSLFASVSSLASGDVEGALSNLSNAAGDALNAFGATGSAPLGDAFGGINAREDAIQNWCWYAMMPNINGASSSIQLPWYYISAANAPYRTIQTESIQRNGKAVFFPESYSVDNLSMTFFMDSSNKSYQYLKAWNGLVLDTTNPRAAGNQGKWGLPKAYKKDIQIFVLSVAKKRLLNIRYINCWPTTFTALPLASGSSDVLSQEITFSVEDVEITVNNDKGLIANLTDTLKGDLIGAATSALSGTASSLANNLFG